MFRIYVPDAIGCHLSFKMCLFYVPDAISQYLRNELSCLLELRLRSLRSVFRQLHSGLASSAAGATQHFLPSALRFPATTLRIQVDSGGNWVHLSVAKNEGSETTCPPTTLNSAKYAQFKSSRLSFWASGLRKSSLSSRFFIKTWKNKTKIWTKIHCGQANVSRGVCFS